MASDLPLTLRVYRSLSTVATPLAGALVKHRLKRGKEDEARVGERKGLSATERPPGPLVWIHGASVGEVLAVAGLVERHARDEHPHPADIGHRDVGCDRRAGAFRPTSFTSSSRYDSPRFVARFLDHWQPSFALFVESDLWPNLILAGAERRIPMIVINGRMSQRSFQRWRTAPATMATLLGRFEMCLVQSQGDADRFSALGSPHVFNTGNLKFDVPAPPADPQKLDAAETGDARPSGRARVVHTSGRGGHRARRAPASGDLFPGLLTIIVPRHPERGQQVAQLTETSRLARRCALARSTAVGRDAKSMWPTRWASSACSIGLRRSCSSAARWSTTAGRIRSSRSSSARRSCTGRMSETSPTSIVRSTRPAAQGSQPTARRW